MTAEADRLEAQYHNLKKGISTVNAVVAQLQRLAVAFHEVPLAHVVRSKWHVARLRCSLAALQIQRSMHREDSLRCIRFAHSSCQSSTIATS